MTKIIRRKGSGSIYLRGQYWWIGWYVCGVPYKQSTKSTDRSVAEELLKVRLAENDLDTLRAHVVCNMSERTLELVKGAQGTVGAISELLVSVDLMNRGFNIFRSLSPHAPCDLVATRGEGTFRIEVKTGIINEEGRIEQPTFRAKKLHKAFDVLAVVCRNGKIAYHCPEIDGWPDKPEEDAAEDFQDQEVSA